jgi:uncharacterized membrane protein
MAEGYKQYDSTRRLHIRLIIAALVTVTALCISIGAAHGHGQEGHPENTQHVVSSETGIPDSETHQAHDAGTENHHGNDGGAPASSHDPEMGTVKTHKHGDREHESSARHLEQIIESAAIESEAARKHDHSAHESWATNSFERFLAWLGKFHPAVTNFPIGLLIAAALAEILLIFRGKSDQRLMHAARYCAALGAFTALLSAGFGWFYAGFDVSADDSVLSAHRWNGTAIGILAMGLGVLAIAEQERRSSGWRNAFRAALFILAIMVSVNGYLGGRMLFGADHYAWPARQHDDTHEYMDH